MSIFAEITRAGEVKHKLLKDGVTESMIREKLPAAENIKLYKVDKPDIEDLKEWMFDSFCETPVCACAVEPDGYCHHGRPSWLIVLGLI